MYRCVADCLSMEFHSFTPNHDILLKFSPGFQPVYNIYMHVVHLQQLECFFFYFWKAVEL